MKTVNRIGCWVVLLLIAGTGCKKNLSLSQNVVQTGQEPALESEYWCGTKDELSREAGVREFHCLRKMCNLSPGSKFNEQTLECECDNGGVFRVVGTQTSCVTHSLSTDGQEIVSEGQSGITGSVQDKSIGSYLEPRGSDRRVQVRVGHLFNWVVNPFPDWLPRGGNRWIGLWSFQGGEPQIEDLVKNLKTSRNSADDSTTDVMFLHVAPEQKMEDVFWPQSNAFINGDFNAPPSEKIGVSLQRAVEVAVDDLRSRDSLNGYSRMYTMGYGGCATGCRIGLSLDSGGSEDYVARFVRQYGLGAVSNEAIEILDARTGHLRLAIYLNPGRGVSMSVLYGKERSKTGIWKIRAKSAYDFLGRELP